MQTLLVTGAAGFIGSNFVRLLLNRGEDVKIIAFDKLTYAGNLANLSDLLDKYGPEARTKNLRAAVNPKTGERIEIPGRQQLWFVRGDICDAAAVEQTWTTHGITQVVHFAA